MWNFYEYNDIYNVYISIGSKTYFNDFKINSYGRYIAFRLEDLWFYWLGYLL